MVVVERKREKCLCEENVHDLKEIGQAYFTIDINLKEEGLIKIKAAEKEFPEPFAAPGWKRLVPDYAGWMIHCEYCPICGRKLKEEKETQRPYKEYQDLRTGESVREYKEE